MKTLYDLLGALPHDNAEDLRTAFRRAVKGAHPDIRPGDPDAALKFREIVRASEILGDTEQRALYDDLLKLARLEQKSASGHPVAARMRKIASGMIALSWASTIAAGFLFMSMSATPVASILSFDTMAAFPPKSQHPTIDGEPMVPPAALPENSLEVTAASYANADPDLAASEVRATPPEGFSACANGVLKSRFDDLDDALQPDTKLLPAYVDPGIIFYRAGKSDHVFPDIVGAKPTEKPGHSRSVPTTSRRRPLVPAIVATSATPAPQRRMTAQAPSRGEAVASAMFR